MSVLKQVDWIDTINKWVNFFFIDLFDPLSIRNDPIHYLFKIIIINVLTKYKNMLMI